MVISERLPFALKSRMMTHNIGNVFYLAFQLQGLNIFWLHSWTSQLHDLMPKSSKMQNHLIHISIQFQYIPQPLSKLSLADPLGTYGVGHTLSFLILNIQQSDQLLGRNRSGSGTARLQLLLVCLGYNQTVHSTPWDMGW